MKDLADYWADKFGLESSLAFTGEAIATGQLISAKQFEQFVLPYFQEAHKYILDRGYKHIYCHQCGEQNANLLTIAALDPKAKIPEYKVCAVRVEPA